MNLLKSIVVFSILYSNYVSAQLPAPEAWASADKRTVRIDPGELEGLPEEVTTDLLSRGCVIPQQYDANKKEGAIRGNFFLPDSSDLAILCSIDRVSTILVYRDSSVREIHELARAADAGYLQTVAGGAIGFSRLVGVAAPNSIQDYYEFFGGPEPPPLTHDGVANIHVGKGSTIWYWYQDQWFELQGND